jgi:PTS system galactitol-specific IIA component
MSEKILSLLSPSTVLIGVEAADRTEVISRLGELLLRAGCVRESFVNAALERESQLPTGLPLDGHFNAAIPHTEVEHVVKPGLALATLSSPVVFQNMVMPEEGVAVHLVILMALDQPKSQVEMLQEIAGVLQDKAIIEKLIQARNFFEIRKAFE